MNDTQKQSFFNAITTLVIALMAVLGVIFGTRTPQSVPSVAPQAIAYATVSQALPGISVTNAAISYTTGNESAMETGLYDYVRVQTLIASSNAASLTTVSYVWSNVTGVNCNAQSASSWASNSSMSYNGVSNTVIGTGNISDVRVLPVQGFCVAASISTTAGSVTPTLYLQFVKTQ